MDENNMIQGFPENPDGYQAAPNNGEYANYNADPNGKNNRNDRKTQPDSSKRCGSHIRDPCNIDSVHNIVEQA